MKAKIDQVAGVQTGFSFRRAVSWEKDGNVNVIRMSDLTASNGGLIWDNLMSVNMAGVNQHHFVKSRDLIFRSRGKTTTATMLATAKRRTVIAAPLLRIRVVNKNVLPEYLCWFLNLSSSQAFLHSRATGTAMVLIGKSALEDLEIPLPPLQIQKQITGLAHLCEKEQKLMKRVASLKQALNRKVLMGMAMKSERT